MKTVIETEEFTKQAEKLWSEEERLDFIDYIAENPTAGDVIRGTDGVRKVRWNISGMGNRGGVRVIYLNVSKSTILLLVMFKKSDRATMKAHEIRGAK